MSRLILMAVAIFFSIFANATSDKVLMLGIMECKVTENYLLEVKDGKAVTYTGYKDSITKGDTLYINYKLYTLFGQENITISVFKPGEAESYMNNIFSLYEKTPYILEPWLFSIRDTYQGNKDRMRIRSSDETLILRRYYKNDWEGVFVQNSTYDISPQITALDCRHKKDVYDQFVDYIISTDGGVHVPEASTYEESIQLMKSQKTK